MKQNIKNFKNYLEERGIIIKRKANQNLENIEKNKNSESTKEFKKLKLNLSFMKGFKVQLNDNKKHSLVQRIEDRTNLTEEKIISIVYKILKIIKNQILNNEIIKRTMYEFKLLKSNIKILFLVNPSEKYIRFSTILNSKQYTKDTVKNELNEKFEEFISIELDY